MNASIRLLPESLINQIAAGEVVERPASAVKELLENSVDAGASDIQIDIIQSGKSSIRVMDNGRGMTKEDLLLAIERHATSKIREYADLMALKSMGFRGEALPSIAAVSRMTIISIPRGGLSGHRLEIWGGKKIGLEEVGGSFRDGSGGHGSFLQYAGPDGLFEKPQGRVEPDPNRPGEGGFRIPFHSF